MEGGALVHFKGGGDYHYSNHKQLTKCLKTVSNIHKLLQINMQVNNIHTVFLHGYVVISNHKVRAFKKRILHFATDYSCIF